MKKKKVVFISIGAVVVIVAILLFMNLEKKEIQYSLAKVQAETVQTSVTATGYIQPVDKVDVGTQVSGVIEKLYVDFNSQVKKGQLLAELDRATLTEKLNQANASLTSAQSELTYARQNYERIKQLYDAKAATEAANEDAVNKFSQAQTNVENAKANQHQAQVNLSYAKIYSPIDGVVLNRAVDQGQTVAASFNTPTLFTIANDLTKMQVEADVDEADIGQVRVGQKVTFTVDAYSEDIFEGTVNQIRLQSTVTSNVVTYTVIIEAPNPEEKLFPGMTASVTIITQSENGLAISAEALNFSPSEDVLNKLKMQSPIHPQANPASNKSADRQHREIWIQTPQGIEQIEIKTGLTDGIHTIVKEGLKESDTVILSASLEKKTKNTTPTANPLMPSRPGGQKK